MVDSAVNILFFLALVFVCLLGFAVLTVAVLYIIDINQHTHTIRRNYPVIGRFRYLI